MGQLKKESNRVKAAGGSNGLGNVKVKGENFYRDAKAAKQVQLLKGGRAIRNAQGKVIKAASFQSKVVEPGRVAPNRKWFGNTRVIGQKALESFRENLAAKVNDPFQVLLKQHKLPMSLLQDPVHVRNSFILLPSFGATGSFPPIPISQQPCQSFHWFLIVSVSCLLIDRNLENVGWKNARFGD